MGMGHINTSIIEKLDLLLGKFWEQVVIPRSVRTRKHNCACRRKNVVCMLETADFDSNQLDLIDVQLDAGAELSGVGPYIVVQSVNEAGSGRGRRENSEGEVVEEHIVPRGTDGMKPMEVAALRGHEEDFKILFRVTSTIPTYPHWSPDGVMRHIDSSEARKQRGLIREENFKQAKTMAEDALCEKNYSTAISSYNKAIVLDPTNESILSNWSLCWALFKVNAKRALYFEWPAPYYMYSSTQVWHQLEIDYSMSSLFTKELTRLTPYLETA
ncbi:hypothetical protein IFM89_008474 [Coptis chinensis]|uniref:Uncharacterized protein n=1 Tax=Coptis chinensis TaxID=261450 RepID=A0A835H2J9_9MAGN|nr:hypothetical protein IFM89_008474 [Coptis chinensis]